MKKAFSFLAIALLIVSGLRAPETYDSSRGICWSGPVLQKATETSPQGQELHKSSSNPFLLHSGFAPSMHPFDFPEKAALSDADISGDLISTACLPRGSVALSPPVRPPIFFSL